MEASASIQYTTRPRWVYYSVAQIVGKCQLPYSWTGISGTWVLSGAAGGMLRVAGVLAGEIAKCP